MASGYVGRFWHAEGERVVCDLCPRRCRLREGQRAFCFVRQNVGGRMRLVTYGRSTGFCIDPIEKKPLNHFYPGSSVLSFGTAGCNLGCRFCQNWNISKAKKIAVLSEKAAPEAIAQTAAQAGCTSVAFTYNDPVIFAEYAIDTARACHDLGLKTVAVTAGYITPEARRDFFSHIDAANVDLKAFSEDFYRRLCFAQLAPVLDTLSWLRRETDVWLEVTTLLIPGHNDSPDELGRLCDWCAETLGPEVPLHFTAYHPDFTLREAPPTPVGLLRRARQQALTCGLKHVYTGNVQDSSGQATSCSGCGELLVERDGYTIGRYHITSNGQCEHCGRAVRGRFEGPAGRWGSRRLPVRIV